MRSAQGRQGNCKRSIELLAVTYPLYLPIMGRDDEHCMYADQWVSRLVDHERPVLTEWYRKVLPGLEEGWSMFRNMVLTLQDICTVVCDVVVVDKDRVVHVAPRKDELLQRANVSGCTVEDPFVGESDDLHPWLVTGKLRKMEEHVMARLETDQRLAAWGSSTTLTRHHLCTYQGAGEHHTKI